DPDPERPGVRRPRLLHAGVRPGPDGERGRCDRVERRRGRDRQQVDRARAGSRPQRPAQVFPTPLLRHGAAPRIGSIQRGVPGAADARQSAPMETERASRWVGRLSATTLFTTALFTTALFPTTLCGQTDWVNRSSEPGMRAGAALAFDVLRGRTVLF